MLVRYFVYKLKKAFFYLKRKAFFACPFLFFFKKKKYFSKILIVRNGAIGDCIVILPLIKALKQTFPWSKITVLTTRIGKEIFSWSPYIDDIIEINFSSLISPLKTQKIIEYLSQKKFDYILLSTFDYNFREITYTFSQTISVEPKFSGYFFRSLTYPSLLPEWQRNLEIGKKIFPQIKFSPPINLFPPKNINNILEKYSLKDKKYWIYHLGGKRKSRIPSLKYQLKTIKFILEKISNYNVDLIITGNSPTEKNIYLKIIEKLTFSERKKLKNLVGKLSLFELLSLVSRSSFVFSPDTGIAHLAGAFNIPQIIFWGPGDLGKWRPLNFNYQKVFYHPISCNPCYLNKCPHQSCFNYFEKKSFWNELEKSIDFFLR